MTKKTVLIPTDDSQEESLEEKKDQSGPVQKNNGLVQKQNNNVASALLNPVDFTQPLPDLDDADVMPFDLMADYWTPEKIGESKKVYFDCIKLRNVLDQADKEVVIELMCVYFYEKVNGQIQCVSNGSKRLVGLFEDGQIKQGTPLLITYLGKKRNKSNSFMSDYWSVKPLLIHLKPAQ